MQYGLAIQGEAAAAVWHHTTTLGGADCLAEIGFGMQAIITLTTLRSVERDHMVTGLQVFNPGAHLHHNASSLMTQNGRKGAFRIIPGQGKGIRMANPGGLDLHQHLTGPGSVQVDSNNLEGFTRSKGHGGLGFHRASSGVRGLQGIKPTIAGSDSPQMISSPDFSAAMPTSMTATAADSAKHITIIPGDGIGPEIMAATLKILDKLDVGLVFDEALAGGPAMQQGLDLIPEETLEKIEHSDATLKGPITTPIGRGFTSVNVSLRQHFNLFANVRPALSIPGATTRYADIDILIVRENMESLLRIWLL